MYDQLASLRRPGPDDETLIRDCIRLPPSCYQRLPGHRASELCKVQAGSFRWHEGEGLGRIPQLRRTESSTLALGLISEPEQRRELIHGAPPTSHGACIRGVASAAHANTQGFTNNTLSAGSAREGDQPMDYVRSGSLTVRSQKISSAAISTTGLITASRVEPRVSTKRLLVSWKIPSCDGKILPNTKAVEQRRLRLIARGAIWRGCGQGTLNGAQ